MRTGLKLGRWFGIELTADWSWALVFVLVTWNSSALFSNLHPSWKAGTSLAVAMIIAASLFASVLVHELAHSLVARALQIRVRHIHLFAFGGESDIEHEPPSPAVEFLMALIGPVANLALGTIWLFVSTVRADTSWLAAEQPWVTFAALDPAATALVCMGPMNIALAILNLVPAFPLEGGRILRAVIWSSTRNLQCATRWASSVGQAFGWAFVALGVAAIFGARVPPFGGGFVFGIGLAAIGLLLRSAAEQSYRRVLVQSLFEEISVALKVRRAFSSPARASFGQSDEHAFLVVEEGRLLGLVSVRDLHRIPRESWSLMRVSEVMTPASRLVVVAAEDDLDVAVDKLAEGLE